LDSAGPLRYCASLLLHYHRGAERLPFAIEYRWGEGSAAHLTDLAAKLVSLPVDVIVVSSTGAARAAREATTTVPIVLAGGGPDPVAMGLAASYARPGGNVTGVTSLASELAG
jgi:putative tryptophan/tyrosine transport system substrate-binding protein